MFKKLTVLAFAILVPLCIVCYIAGGVLNMILGENYYHGFNYGNGYHDVTGDDVVKEWSVTDTSKSYEFSIEARENLTFKLSGVNAIIMSSYNDDIVVSVKNDNVDRDTHVMLAAEGSTTTIEVHPSNITFNPLNGGGLTSWLEDMFGIKPKCTVYVMVPQKTFEILTVQQGSGNVSFNNINANYNTIDIGSGNFELLKNPMYTSKEFNVNLGSGTANLRNLATSDYKFNIGSGKFDARGLTGTGDVNIGSGDVTLSYMHYFGLYLRKGSGTLNMFVPPNTSSRINAEMGSGKIVLNTDNLTETISKTGEDYFFGDEDSGNFLYVNNGSGNIYIQNHTGSDTVYVPLIPDGIKDDIDSGTNSSTEINSEFSTNLPQSTPEENAPLNPEYPYNSNEALSAG